MSLSALRTWSGRPAEPITADSVSSSCSRSGARPVSSRVRATSATRSESQTWRTATLTLTKIGGSPGWASCQRRAWWQAVRRIQRPRGTIDPSSSASAMNRFGASTPNWGWFQRMSASTPRTRPSAMPTSGWYSSANSPRSMAGRSVAASAWRVMRLALRSGSKRVQRARPSALAQYRVVSAACIRAVGVVPAVWRSTTPTEAVTDSRRSQSSKGGWRAARTDPARSASWSVPVESSTRRANSSPPSRATRGAPDRAWAASSAHLVSRSATAASSRSPTRWPWVSLTALKPSRSR